MKHNLLSKDMSRYIWHILSLKPYVMMSWGIDPDSVDEGENYLEFHVQGFLHTGNVRITYIEGADLFQVCLYDDSGNLKDQTDDIYLDNLVDVIDMKVENDLSGDYEEKVINHLIAC